MNWINDTLAEFGHRVGLQNLGLGEHGVVQLQLQSGGILTVQPHMRDNRETEVLVCLSLPLGYGGAQLLKRALMQAHYSRTQSLTVQVAVHGQGPQAQLLAMTRMDERELTAQRLEQTFEQLQHWLGQLGA